MSVIRFEIKTLTSSTLFHGFYFHSSFYSRRAICLLLGKEWALNTGELPPGGLPRNNVVKYMYVHVTDCLCLRGWHQVFTVDTYTCSNNKTKLCCSLSIFQCLSYPKCAISIFSYIGQLNICGPARQCVQMNNVIRVHGHKKV